MTLNNDRACGVQHTTPQDSRKNERMHIIIYNDKPRWHKCGESVMLDYSQHMLYTFYITSYVMQQLSKRTCRKCWSMTQCGGSGCHCALVCWGSVVQHMVDILATWTHCCLSRTIWDVTCSVVMSKGLVLDRIFFRTFMEEGSEVIMVKATSLSWSGSPSVQLCWLRVWWHLFEVGGVCCWRACLRRSYHWDRLLQVMTIWLMWDWCGTRGTGQIRNIGKVHDTDLVWDKRDWGLLSTPGLQLYTH